MSGQLTIADPGRAGADITGGRPRARGMRPFVSVAALAFALAVAFPISSFAEAADSRRYLIDVLPAEKGLPQNTVTGIAQTPDGYLWLTTLDGAARFDGVRFRRFKAADTPALGSGRIRFLFPGKGGRLWLSTQEGGVIELENSRFAPLALPASPGAPSAVIQAVEGPDDALWLSTERGEVRRIGQGFRQLISTNWTGIEKGGFEVRADSRGRLWALGKSGLYRVDGGQLTPALRWPAGECVVLCPSRGGGWWIANKDSARLWRNGDWVVHLGNPGIAVGDVNCGLEDRAGNLWVGTASEGLFHCQTNGRILRFGTADGLSGNSVRTLFEDAEGNLWVGMENGGLNRLRLPLFAVYGTAQGLSSDRITSLSAGPDGSIWIGTDGNGLNRILDEGAQPISVAPPSSAWRIATVLADQQGRVWMGLRTGGVYRWQDGEFKAVPGLATANYPTRSLYEDSRQGVWIGQRNTRRLIRVKDGKVETVMVPPSLPPADVRAMAEDGEGNFWFGMDGSGLWRWRDGQFARFTRENGLGSDFVWALRAEPDGSLWIGTYGGGLARLKNGRVVACTSRDGLADDVICHIADDGRGQYWISSNQGIFRVAKSELNEFAEGARSRIHCVAYGKSDGVPALECEGGCQPAGCASHDGRLWFPTVRGVAVVDPAAVSTNSVPPPVHIEDLVVDGIAVAEPAWRTNIPPGGAPGSAPAQSASRPTALPLTFRPGSRRFEFHYTALNFTAPEQLRFRHKLDGIDAGWVETGLQRSAGYDRLPHGAYTFRVQACNREGAWNEAGDAVSFAVLPYFWETRWFAILFLAGFGSAVAWIVRVILRRRHERQVQWLRRLNALERERTRIARDIHDDLGGSLTEIGYLGALAVRDSKSLGEARDQISRIMERTRELARRLDETVWAVNPKNDSSLHLATYLCHFTREFLEPTGMRCRLEVPADLPAATLTTEVRHGVFLAVKEALNNAAKHSGADEVRLRVAAGAGVMVIEVSDNGRGFSSDVRAGSHGLGNMKDRMEELGGEFRIITAPGQGTTIQLRIRLPAENPIQLEDAGRPANS